MGLNPIKYDILEEEDDDDDIVSKPVTNKRPFSKIQANSKTLLLTLSCIINLLFVATWLTSSPIPSPQQSKYAGLEYNLLKPFHHTTPYSSPNLTLAQEHWDALNFDSGMIYLPPTMIKSLDLPPAQPFPWDETQSIYLLNGHHNLHCLQSIEFGLMAYHHGHQPAYPIQHILHCLDALRDDVICHADDTPRYTTSTPTPESGVGQMRLCRDWGKLEAWAEKWSGCWRYGNETWDHGSELERWGFCEEGERGYEGMREWAEGREGGGGGVGDGEV